MFLGGLIYVGFFLFFFLHIQNNLKLQSFCVMLLMKQNMFVSVSSVSACDFFFVGVISVQGFFCLVLLKALGIYLRFDFCPRLFDHPRHLKSCVSSWGLDSCIEDTNYKKDLLVK